MELTVRGIQAKENFLKGFNCAQSVVLAFADLLPFDEKTALRLVSPFGGGMGRLREVCGAVSGMFFILGNLYGYDDPNVYDGKAELYARVQELAAAFREENGTIICRELLNLDHKNDVPTPAHRTASYYQSRPCGQYIAIAASLLETYIKEHPYESYSL